MEDKKDTGAGLLKEPQDFKPIKVKGSDYQSEARPKLQASSK
jgi:hypothetical protein